MKSRVNQFNKQVVFGLNNFDPFNNGLTQIELGNIYQKKIELGNANCHP